MRSPNAFISAHHEVRCSVLKVDRQKRNTCCTVFLFLCYEDSFIAMEAIMQLTSKDWWKAAGVRAIKTVAQAAVSTYGAMNLISTVEDAKTIVLTSLFAGVLSILTSIAGLPELKQNDRKEEKN
jgi:hypothetical protein